MTLDEAIAHAQDVANSGCSECCREHGQLAGWLMELKAYSAHAKQSKLAELLQDAMDALAVLERETVDEYGHCRISLACSDCPLRGEAPDQQCEWVRAAEARAALSEAGGGEQG